MKTDLITEIVVKSKRAWRNSAKRSSDFMREILRHSQCDGPDWRGRKRVMEEMRQLGFEDIRFDRMGNVLG